MPIVNIDARWLNELIGQELPPEELGETLDQIGCDVEEVTTIARGRCSGCNAAVEAPAGSDEANSCPFCGLVSETAFAALDSQTVIRLDLLAARPDLFDVGGLARALRGYLSVEEGLPRYDVEPSGVTVHADPAMARPESYRPYILGGVVTMEQGLGEAELVALMKLQESLHWGVGRDRKLASMGVHDMDFVEGDIHYRPLDPDGDTFIPLGRPDEPMTGRQILEEHPKGTAYAHLLADLAGYPALVDDAGNVLSMPPIINSELTKLRAGSKRLFLDVTGISEAAVTKALDTFACSLVEMGGTVASVEVVTAAGERIVTPDLTPREVVIDLPGAKRWLGLPLDEESLPACLRRMRFDVEPEGDGAFRVRYPAFRTDIRHTVDVFEDLAIGYRYRDIEPQMVATATPSVPRPEEVIAGHARTVMTGLGHVEIMSLPMVTEADHFTRFRREVPERYVRVGNPKLKELKVIREHLLTGLMQALEANAGKSYPIRLFEVENVVALDADAENGVREERAIAFVEIGPDAGYATARATMDALLAELCLTGTYSAVADPAYIEGRTAAVDASDGGGDGVTGRLGELHPEVITAFGLDHPIAAGELVLARVW